MAKLKLYINLPLFYMLYRLGTTVPSMPQCQYCSGTLEGRTLGQTSGWAERPCSS